MNITGNIRATGTISGKVDIVTGIGIVNVTRNEPLEEKKMNIRKPKNTEREIIEITKAFFRGEELEFHEYSGRWEIRDNNYFPDFSTLEYRIKQDIPEGYEEVDYRLPKMGELIWVIGTHRVEPAAFDYEVHRCIILKKKAPKLEVGQIWKDTSNPYVQSTLKIVEIQDDMVYYVAYDMNGKVSCPGKFSVGDPAWTNWLVLQK